jgi:hypothetical protein
MTEFERLPYEDYQVIACILLPYVQGVPDTVTKLFERDAILKTLEALYQRTSAGSLPTGEEQLPLLTSDELSVVLNALTSFVGNVARFFPPTGQREEVIQSCEKWHLYFSTVFAPLSIPISDKKESMR